MKEITKLNVITDDGTLHEFEIIDNTLDNINVCWELIEKLERVLGHDIVDYFVLKEFKE